MRPRSKMSCAVAVAAFGLVLLNGVNFVAPNVPKSLMLQYLASMEMWRNGEIRHLKRINWRQSSGAIVVHDTYKSYKI